MAQVGTAIFINNKGFVSPALSAVDGAVVTFENVEGFNNMSHMFGGVFALTDAIMTINNSIVATGNETTEDGGVIYALRNDSNGADFTIKLPEDKKIEYNTAGNGGATLKHSSTLELDGDVTFVHNNATKGGSIYSQDANLVLTESRKLTFQANTASEDGSALYILDTDVSHETHVNDYAFVKNVGPSAFYIQSNDATVENNTFNGNEADIFVKINGINKEAMFNFNSNEFTGNLVMT